MSSSKINHLDAFPETLIITNMGAAAVSPLVLGSGVANMDLAGHIEPGTFVDETRDVSGS